MTAPQPISAIDLMAGKTQDNGPAVSGHLVARALDPAKPDKTTFHWFNTGCMWAVPGRRPV
jgi:hypothetical protein